MAGLHDVFRLAVSSHSHLNGTGTISRRDTCRYPSCSFDGNRKIRVVRRVVVIHHQWKLEMFAALAGERKANQSTRIGCHEINIFSSYALCSNNQITFILTILIVHQDHHLPKANVVNYFFCRVKFHSAAVQSCLNPCCSSIDTLTPPRLSLCSFENNFSR